MHSKSSFTIMLTALSLLSIGVWFIMSNQKIGASQALIPINPSEVSEADLSKVIVLPLLIPPIGLEEEVPLSSVSQSSLVGRTIGELRSAETFDTATLQLPTGMIDDGEIIGFQILATTKYMLEEDVVYVSVSRPTSAALFSTVELGHDRITLENGKVAWATHHALIEETPNEITYLDDELIITVAGSFSLNQLAELTSELIVTSY